VATRIQRKRTKGWRMPEGAVYVGRPTKWGNPFALTGGWQEAFRAVLLLGEKGNRAGRLAASIKLYRMWLTCDGVAVPESEVAAMDPWHKEIAIVRASLTHPRPTVQSICDELGGKDLACWCPLNQPCHADVLLEIANGLV